VLSGGSNYEPRAEAPPAPPPSERATLADRLPAMRPQIPRPAVTETEDLRATGAAGVMTQPLPSERSAGTETPDPVASAVAAAVSGLLQGTQTANDIPEASQDTPSEPRTEVTRLSVGSLDFDRRDLGTGLEVLSGLDGLGGFDSRAAPERGALTGQVIGPAEPSRPDGTARAGAPAADLRSIDGDRVNMRAGPGTEYSVLTTLSRGAAVEVLSGAEGDWLRLRVLQTGETGYIANWLVSASSE